MLALSEEGSLRRRFMVTRVGNAVSAGGKRDGARTSRSGARNCQLKSNEHKPFVRSTSLAMILTGAFLW